jgi:hypothetical protein
MQILDSLGTAVPDLSPRFLGSLYSAPLTYPVCEHEAPMANNLALNYDDIDEDFVATCHHGTFGFRADNTYLYGMINSLIIDGSCWSYVQPIDKQHDGCLTLPTVKGAN